MNSLIQDLRYGLRVLLKARGFSVLALLTLALGIGANTAIFGIVDAVLLRPLALQDPGRLMLLQEEWKGVGSGGVSVGNFSDLRQQQTFFEKLSASYSASFNLATEDAPERIDGEYVSQDFFETMGVAPLRGRVFSADEQQRGHHRVAVISERLWRTRFHSDAGLVGRPIQINGDKYTVVGVMPGSFDPRLDASAVWLPAAFLPEDLRNHDSHFLDVFGRLKPGVTRIQAQAEMNVLAARQAKLYPIDDKNRGFSLTPLTEALLGDRRLALLTVLAAVGFVLLIACANIANLQLARARARQREIAVRVSLGATPGRIIRQLLAENLVLALAGGAAGVLLAFWAMSWLVANAPSNVPRIGEAHVGGVTLAFASGLALLSSILFGLAPALRSASLRLTESFNEGSTRAGASRDWLRSALVVGQVALALMLLVGAGLLVRSALVVSHLDPGFNSSNLTVGRIGLSEAGYRDPAIARQTFERLLSSMKALPGVESAAVVSRAPMSGYGSSNGIIAEGKALDPSNLVDGALRIVSPGYVATMRVPLKAGRAFTPDDTRSHPLIVLINEQLARTLWPGENPIGKRFACCEVGPKGRLDPVWHEVVGVVGDVRAWGLDQQIRGEFYMPMAQMPPAAWDWIGRTMDVVVRTHGSSISIGDLRSVVSSVAPGVPIYNVSTMQQKISNGLEESHFDTFLMSIFAVTALLLASVGVYGVLSYVVALRTREIGIRMALGADRHRIVHGVLAQGARLAFSGVAIGVVGALIAVRLVASLLYGIRPTDVLTYAAVSFVLAGVALLASYLPARRASRVDPMVALRYD